MEQIGLFSNPQLAAANYLKDAAAMVVEQNQLPVEKLLLCENKDYYSVKFFGSVVLCVGGKKKKYISFPSYALQNAQSLESPAQKDQYTKIFISDFADAENYKSLAAEAMQGVIDKRPAEFDCCSRYMECSDAKVCTNPNIEFSLKCSYRKILKSGRIFYGKNRNVEA